MNNMLVIVFDNEQQALEGANVLWQLHEDLNTVVFSQTILQRDADGTIKILRGSEKDDLGLAMGALVGGIVGCIGGPAGIVAGTAIGAVSGIVIDHWDADLREDFLNVVTTKLEPEKFAVLADVSEHDESLVDEKMSSLDGTLFRRPRSAIVDAHVHHEIDQTKSELQHLEARVEEAADTAKQNLSLKFEAVREKLTHAVESAKAKIHQIRADAKVNREVLDEQIAKAVHDQKEAYEAVKENAQAEADRRITRLQQQFDH